MQSRFIKLTEYCLLEYQYESLSPSSPILINSPFYGLTLGEGEIYLYNPDSALFETGNIKDLTVVPLLTNGGRFVHLDSENSPSYTEYAISTIPGAREFLIPSGSLIADRVRFHFATGFQFDDFTSLVLSVRQDMNNGNTLILANILLNSITLGDSLLFATRPMIIGNTMYDRYVDLIVPSIKNIDEQYYTAPNPKNTFEYKATSVIESTESNISVNAFSAGASTITLSAANSKIEEDNIVSGIGIAPNTTVTSKVGNVLTLSNNTIAASSGAYAFSKTTGIGLVRNNPITVNLFECKDGPSINTANEVYSTYDINQSYTTQISQSNDFDLVGAKVREAADGDYIEFFATWNEGFPEEFIAILEKRTGHSWIIFHQLTIFEQIGSGFIKSGDATFFQDTNFDEPLVFRPILKNANEAVSMAIDYSVRLVNRTTNEQVIRTGSLTVVNPNKYGRSLLKLELADKPNSNRINNLIVTKMTDSLRTFNDIEANKPALATNQAVAATQSTTPVPQVEIRTVTEYVQVLHTANTILLAETSKLTGRGKSTELAFGQGLLSIVVNPFDNVFKFKVTKEELNSSGNPAVRTMDLTQFSGFELVFGSDNSRVSVKNTTTQAEVNSDMGEILFKIDSATTSRILNLEDSKFYIVSVGKDGSRNALYTGKWYKSDDTAVANSQNTAEEARVKAEESLRKRLEDLSAQVQALQKENDILRKSEIKYQVAQPSGDTQSVAPTVNPINIQKPVARGYGGVSSRGGSGRPYIGDLSERGSQML